MAEKPALWKGASDLSGKDIKTEDEFARFLVNLFHETREAQKPQAEKWRRYDRLYRGKQWERALEPWRAQVVVNACFQIVESQLPTLSTSEMRMGVVPVEGGDRMTADLLDELMSYLNWKHRWPTVTVLAQKTALKLGGCILKTGWDPLIGLSGDVSYCSVLPYMFFPDPDALTLVDCNFVFEAKMLSLAEIRAMHPKRGKLVKEGAGLAELGDLALSKDRDGITVQTEPYRGVNLRDFQSDGKKVPQSLLVEKALYCECWMRDFTTTRENGKERLLYPGGRHIVFCGDIILKDEPNPFWHRRFPYVLLPDYPDDHGFWPIGEVELIQTLQLLINKVRSQVVDNLTVQGNATWIVDDQSGVKASMLGNGPNLIVRKRQGTEVRRDAPPPLPEYVIAQHQIAMNDIENITGIHDIVQGRRPEGVRAYSAIRQLLEAAERRLALKILFQQEALREAARQLVANIMQYYDPERYKRIYGEEKVREVVRSRLSQGLNRDGRGKAVKDRLVFSLEEAYEMYDFASEVEVMTHNTKQMMRDMARDLFSVGAIDREALLKLIGLPGWEEIIERMEGRNPQEPAASPEAAPPKAPAARPEGEAAPPGERAIPEEVINMMYNNAGAM